MNWIDLTDADGAVERIDAPIIARTTLAAALRESSLDAADAWDEFAAETQEEIIDDLNTGAERAARHHDVWVLAGDHAEARVAPDEWARGIERIIDESNVDVGASSVALDIAITAIKTTHIGLSAAVINTYSIAVPRDSVHWETEETDAEEVLG